MIPEIGKTKKRPEIACCIPLSWDFIPKYFFLSWYLMHAYSCGRYEMRLIFGNSCYMDEMRDNLGKSAMEHKPDYIFWLDADQFYPQKTPEILMKHIENGKSVVGGLTAGKDDQTPLVYNIITAEGAIKRRKDVKPGQGVIKVDAMGFGGIMMTPRVLKDIEFPWFRTQWNPKIKERPGEDTKFYVNCKKFHVDVWCDTDLVYDHIITHPIGVKEAS